MYGVIETAVLSKTVTTSDHLTYQIEVTYSNTAGIPLEGTELLVSEIKEGDASYDAYISASANKLGIKPENIDISRAFDIKIVDRNDHSIVYEPNEEVEVSITLIGADLDEYEEVDVIHFADSTSSAGYSVYDLNNTVTGDTVRFTTDGFSVYVIISEVPVRTYRFYSFDEYGDYMEYPFTDDSGATVFAQTIKNGETPVVPSNPVNPQDPTATFAGWYEATSPAGSADVELASEPYDFDNIPEITVDEEVRLYAKYASYAYIIFHDQYDIESKTFPVAYTRRAELTGEEGLKSAKVQISDLSTVYTSTGGADMAFSGWSETPITEPGAAKDDDGHDVQAVSTDADGCITVTGETHLYPIYKAVHQLTYYSAQSGMSASYVPPVKCFADEPVTYDVNGSVSYSLPSATRNGYQFLGWWTGTLSSGGGVETVHYGAQITNAEGGLVTTADDGGVYISNGKLYLRSDATLYARWLASYSIVYWKQATTDYPDTDEKHYEYTETLTKTAEIGTTVSVAEEDREDGR